MIKKFLVYAIIVMFIVINMGAIADSYIFLEKDFSVCDKNIYFQQISSSQTLYVGGVGPGNYSSIQTAINNANTKDTVFVFDNSSPYYENVVVNKSIILLGENKDTTIIDGNKSGNVIDIISDRVIIDGFTIRNGYYYDGININSNYNTITDNNINSNNWNGIDLGYSSFNTIKSNLIKLNNADGIRLYFSDNNTITCNTIISSYYGDGIELYNSSNNNITENSIYNNKGGIDILISCKYNNISDNIIMSNHQDGIILIFDCNQNIISNNNIILNTRWGIGIGYSNYDNIIMKNIISENEYGINFWNKSNNNTIYHNNFVDNEQNAYDECNNIWDDVKFGNYWSDYEEKYPDAKKKWGHCIWNTPYEIPGGDNKDKCPLIKQWPNTLSKTMKIYKISMFSIYPIIIEEK